MLRPMQFSHDVARRPTTDLLWWLVQMGMEDREHYREIREALWVLRVERSETCSNIQSKCS